MNIGIIAGIATLALGIAAPLTASARPYTPHHTGPSYGHRHVGHVGHRHRTTKAGRVHRRADTHRFGNPNSRNPALEGYQQQLGNTTNGPRC